MDTLLGTLLNPVFQKLNRPGRSASALYARGLLVQAVFLPLGFFAGSLLNELALTPYVGAPVAALLLARVIAFRGHWDRLKADKGARTPDAADIRGRIEQLALAFARDWLASLVLFTIGGFALLLPFRLLASGSDQRSTTGGAKPASSFKRAFVPLYDVAALPGALWAAMLLALAPIFIPGTQLSAVRGFGAIRLRGILSRVITLTIVAYALNFSFVFDVGKGASTPGWIGPAHGRAKLTQADLRLAGKLMLAACTLGFVTMAMGALVITVYASSL